MMIPIKTFNEHTMPFLGTALKNAENSLNFYGSEAALNC
jgi:hypothetical protein